MAFLPIAHVAINYRDFPNNWIKAYKVGTTTPKPMALKSDGTNQVAKLEVNIDGFLVSSGNALVIPYISGLFDMFLFPTEAEADANNTTNAIRIADGSQGEEGSTVSDTIELSDGQTTVTLLSVIADTAIIYIQGQNVDQGKLLKAVGSQANDYSVTDGSTIELVRSYPEGSFISALGFTEIESGEVISVHGRTGAVASANGDYNASQITNTPAGNITATEQQAVNAELDGFIATNTTNIATNVTNIETNVTEIATAKLNDAIYNKQTGTAYTLVPGDRGKTVSINNAAANIITIDTNANQAIVLNAVMLLRQLGAGVTTINAVAGVLLNGVDGGSVAFIDRYDTASIDQQDTDDWIFSGSGVVS